jgi:pyruvate dehydrogenase E2 component (dihydrolipoamide acetyltransferase)
MAESVARAPHVTHQDEADVTALVEMRSELNAATDDRLTFTPFFIRAVVAALAAHPVLNAVLDEAAGEIVYRDHHNIGVATATEAGLMVPVVEDAGEKGLAELAAEIAALTERARERTITTAELEGSTFTITNVGVIGGGHATPILNYPETGVLAFGAITRKPRVVTADDGSETIEPRSVAPLSLSFDHRVADGADAARFMNDVKRYLEQPALLLLE